MFAMLGVIPFEFDGSPEGYDSTSGYNYAELRVIGGKPVLQWIGDDLQRLNFDLVFNVSFTNPALQLMALRTAAALHLAYPLVFGIGTYVGLFVIESIKLKATVMTDLGGLVSIKVGLALKEFVSNEPATLTALAAAAITPLLGIAPPPTAPASSNGSAATPRASPLLSVPSATAAAEAIAPSLDFGDVPLATIVRMPAGAVAANPAAFAAPAPVVANSVWNPLVGA